MNWLHELIEGQPDAAPALIDHDGARYSYGELRAMVAETAETLARAGIRPGDRVLLVSENCALYCVTIFALSQLDAWVSPINARQSAEELDAIAEHSGARAMVFTCEASKEAGSHAEQRGAAVLGQLPCGAIRVTNPVETTPEPVPSDPAQRVAALMYTTGTTSAPKGVMLTHANLCWNARISAELRGMVPGDVVLGVLPGTHIFGFSSTTLANFHAGSTLRCLPRFSPQAVLDAFAEGAAIMPAVPQMYARILAHLDKEGDELKAPALRYVSAGGSPLDPDWKERIEQRFGLPLNNGYGLTETSPSVAATRPDQRRSDLSCGPPLPGVTLKIDQADEQGVGEILIHSPGVMKGYYRAPERTAEVLGEDGYFRSGDLGRLDEDGNLHVVGRTKELIIRSGFNVYPPEIEAMLTRHDAVSQAAVVGRQIPGDEEILAFVMARAGTSEDDLHAYLRERLTGYKRPSRIFIVEDFPTAATGKILKHKILTHFADLLAQPAADPA